MTAVQEKVEYNIPPGTKLPTAVQAAAFILLRRRVMQYMRNKYGPSFRMSLPLFGEGMVITEPALIKQLFQTSTELVANPEPNLGVVLGEGSLFALQKEEHHRRRKLLVPPFHGRRMQSYEGVMIEEAMREIATWPEGEEFETLEPMMRITLNIILRTVFGAEGAEFEELRKLLPPMVSLASRIAVLPLAVNDYGRFSPGGRYAAYRKQFDRIIDSLVEKAEKDPNLEERGDVLSLMMRARYEDGEAMSRSHLADELLTMLAAGHETTATSLSWAFERLTRHPELLQRLQKEADEGGTSLRQATIHEIQRTRPVIEGTGRTVIGESLELGEWVLPKGFNILVAAGLTHDDDTYFPNAAAFDPDRFLENGPDLYTWVPFGGGVRRCIGAAFANMEMMVVLATVLKEFDFRASYQPDEKWHSRGVAVAPAKGGRVTAYRRKRSVEAAPALASAGVA